MSLTTGRVCPQVFLLTFMVFTVSGVEKLTITPDQGTTLTISRTSSECKVCTVKGRARQCEASLSLRDGTPVSVELECSKRQQVFDVEIVRNIECTTKSCNGTIVLTDSSSPPLLNFNRKFTWNLKATAPKALKIDFTNTGLRQIKPSQKCPDQHTYALKGFRGTEVIAMGTYCRTGAITDVQILRQSSFSLEVPAGQKLQSGQFSVSIGEEIKTLAKISVVLPQGESDLELLTPNYPDSFPDDDVMEWRIEVPAKYRASVQLLNLSQPRCLYKETAMEYHGVGRAAVVVMLNQNQPVQSQGRFTMLLRNCKMDRSRAGSPGLSFAIKLSSRVVKTPSTVSCRVDTKNTPGLSLQIEKLRSASHCEMKQNSVRKDNITVLPNSDTQLSFLDCLPQDVQVTAMRVIECYKLRDCPKTPIPLSVPSLPSCLSASLSRVTWTFTFPLDGTVEFTSPGGGLRQSLPGQSCNDSIVIKLAEDDGMIIGNFCRQGAIQKVQIHTNMSVSLSGMKSGALKTTHLLTACIKNEISERYIFTVSPKKDKPLLLATPGWPEGMKSQSTASWIVTVPPKMEAHIMFPNVTQPKCSKRHTNIKVQVLGKLEELYSRREDETKDNEITVPGSFFLNMSNCMPERDYFSVITKITLKKNQLLTIIVSVVAAVLAIFIIVLVAVCVVIRKKKKKLDHQMSIYNPNGTSFLPGYNGHPRTPDDDDDSHVYASIEDTLVYTHLLRKGAEMGIYGEHDAYRSYTGHTDSQKPDSGPDGVEVSTYQSFQQQPPSLPNRPPSHVKPMVDNEIYQAEEEQGLGPRMDPEGGN